MGIQRIGAARQSRNQILVVVPVLVIGSGKSRTKDKNENEDEDEKFARAAKTLCIAVQRCQYAKERHQQFSF